MMAINLVWLKSSLTFNFLIFESKISDMIFSESMTKRRILVMTK